MLQASAMLGSANLTRQDSAHKLHSWPCQQPLHLSELDGLCNVDSAICSGNMVSTERTGGCYLKVGDELIAVSAQRSTVDSLSASLQQHQVLEGLHNADAGLVDGGNCAQDQRALLEPACVC